MIDIYDSGLFLGAVVKTLQQTFPCVYAVAIERPRSMQRETFVVIGAMRKINIEDIVLEKPAADSDLWILNNSEIEILKTKAHEAVLTDDYVPVENMLAPVVRQSAVNAMPVKYIDRAKKFEKQANLLESQGRINESRAMYDKSIATYKSLIKAAQVPTAAVTAYNNMGQILAKQQRWQEAIDAAKGAIECNEKDTVKHSISDIYYNISMASKQLGRDKDASEYMGKAIEAYREDLAQEPNSIKTLRNLVKALLETNRLEEAAEYLRLIIVIEPHNVWNHITLADVLSKQQRYDEAVAVLEKAITFFSDARNENAVAKLQKYLRSIEDSKKANKN
ncbi:MAG: tetratricopeptide repeat protein, partial [Phycisphaerae bacterium]|jgi:tetratricopeptide (TPR) repeat protein